MNQGRVRQVGTPQHVYDHPADTFVATFLGSPPMNLLEQDAHTILGFRPESFVPRQDIPAGTDAEVFAFKVRQVEYLGADRLIYGAVDTPYRAGQTVIADLPVTITTPVAEGRIHEFAVPRRALRTFDAATGLARDRGAA
jgi:multiple sugar transport system ATP-binding protein